MSFTNKNFNTDIAKDIGTDAAIIFYNICFWIEKNKANNKSFYEGSYWTYNSIKAFGELFPWLSTRKIRTCLNKLEKKGFIKTGNFNKNKYDHTTWYAIGPKCQIDLTKLTNRSDKTDKPIPNNNTYIEKINKKEKENSSSPAGNSEVPLTSKNSLTPCTPLEIWELAMKLDISIRHVRQKHTQIMEMIEVGDFQRKYKKHKTVYYTLKRWLEMAIEKGYINYCNEIEAIENPNEHPDKVAWRNEALKIADEMRKRGEL